MSDIVDQLTDRKVAHLAGVPISGPIYLLAREVQAWRALVNGGPCEKCEGTGQVFSRMLDLGLGDGPERVTKPCPDCTNGTRPGLIERLEAIHRQMDPSDGPNADMLVGIIAEMRRMVTL